MLRLRFPLLLLVLLAAAFLLGSCAPAAATPVQTAAATQEARELPAATEAPALEEPVQPSAGLATQAPVSTSAAAASPQRSTQAPAAPTRPPVQTPLPTASPVSLPTSTPEDHVVQVEWPLQMRLGESDVIRLALVPSSQGLLLVTEYPEHQVVTQTVAIPRREGAALFAVARLDGVGFDISPTGDQPQYLEPAAPLTWRWSLTPRRPGSHRISASLALRWTPATEDGGPVREAVVYSRTLDVRVISYLGLSQSQAMLSGLLTLLLGGGLSLFALVIRPRSVRAAPDFELQTPNPHLAIDLPPGLQLGPAERGLLQSLFQRYARLIVEHEFLSGYSGARTFLALPIRRDGRSDAYTIAKIGEKQAILREHRNYESFVKDTLPPITARIQRPPVSNANAKNPRLAALQYTFIGEPGRPPRSLRDAFTENPDPAWIQRLLDTFGPNWWLQRKPLTFRMAAEYDRVLPTHLVVEPDEGKGLELDGRRPADSLGLAFDGLQVGDRITLRNFPSIEMRLDGASLSLQGAAGPGRPPLRLRWLSTQRPEGATGRIVATRRTLLRDFTRGFDLFGLPDPLEDLDGLLSETIQGSQSILHGDLNLENILVGPGGMLWLIDFAQTREGHTLFDFAHLGAEIVAHVAAERVESPADFLAVLAGNPVPAHRGLAELLSALDGAAGRLVFNPASLREYRLALAVSCLGALKYANLDRHARHLLYLSAARLLQNEAVP